MKKVLLLIAFILGGGSVHADSIRTKYDNVRSTTIAGAWTHALVATGPVYLYDIDVPTGASGSHFRYFNSTWAGGITSTSTWYDTGSVLNKYDLSKILNSGFMFSTIGNSTITVKWDWFISANPGQESRGK